MIRTLLISALICSTLPTKLPVRQWETFDHNAFTIQYPPCWNEVHDTDGLILSSPDGYVDLMIRVLPKAYPVDCWAMGSEYEPTKASIRIGKRRVSGAEWNDRSGFQQCFAMASGQHAFWVSTNGAGNWEPEVQKIFQTFRAK